MHHQRTLQRYVSSTRVLSLYNSANISFVDQVLQPYAPSPSPRPASIAEASLSRRTSVLNRSTSSLTRRRSLLATPGVATRNSPIETTRRPWNSWRSPQLDEEKEARWKRQDTVENSPLTRTTALDSTEEGRESPEPRAQTPADMEYSHIGTLKLGSLRIANGEPSPAASAKLRWHAAQAALQGEDYFSPEALDSPIMMKSTRRRRHVRSQSAQQPPTPPLYRNLPVSEDARRAKTTSRYGTPPKSEAQRKSPRQRQPYALQFQELDLEPEPVRRLRVMNKSQDTLSTVLDSQLDVSHEVLEIPQPIFDEDHDEGFASDDSASFRDEAIRILDGTMFSEPAEAPIWQEPVGPSGSSMSQKKHRVIERPPPTKADSGYSSGGSLKTKHREAWKPGTIPTVSKKPSTATDLRQSEIGSEKDNDTSSHKHEQTLQTSTSQEFLPSAQTDEHMKLDNIVHRHRSQEDFQENALPLDWNIDDLSLGTKAPKTPSTPTSFISQFSLDKKSSAKKWLPKRTPSSQELPVVQSCDPIPEGSIPSIPTDVRKQFVRRLSEAPGMECLTHTYPTKGHVNLEETELDLPALEPIKFPSPPPTPEPESRGRHHKRAATERSSSLHGLRRSLSLFRRKTKERNEELQSPLPDEPTVMNLGTTAASLGRSPYDVALPNAQQKQMSSPTHPHQLGNSMSRAKSMVSMDAQTAARLARLRSKDRASQRPGMPARPKSYYSEREAISDADIHRRHSFYGHAPPMPTIPSIGELAAASRQCEQQNEAPVQSQPNGEATSGPTFRARSKGRGRVVTPLIEKFDRYGKRANGAEGQSGSLTAGNEPTYHAALQESRVYRPSSRGVTRRLKTKVNHPDWG